MDPHEMIITRRSIRKYTNQKIPNSIMQQLLEAGMQAPSAGNEQPWEFIILDDKTLFPKINSFHPHAQMLLEADSAILVCGNLQKEKHKGYWMLDCSAATQNILLAAHALGLGSCWLGIYPREERIQAMQTLLHIPEHIIPFSLIALGYPAEIKQQEQRYHKYHIHSNHW